MEPDEWYAKGQKLPTPEERIKYYMSGLSLPHVFRSLAWRGVGEAREEMGDVTGAEQAYDNAADTAIAAAEGVDIAKIKADYSLGKCPKCDSFLTDGDISDIEFRGLHHRHTVYVCRKCNTIIGFSAWHSH